MSINISDYHRLMPFLPPLTGQHLWNQDDLFVIVEENRAQQLKTQEQTQIQNQTNANQLQQKKQARARSQHSSMQQLNTNPNTSALNEERRKLKEREIMALQLQVKLQKMKQEEQKLAKYLDFNDKKSKIILEKTKMFHDKGINVQNILNQTQLGDSGYFDPQNRQDSSRQTGSEQIQNRRLHTNESFQSDSNKNNISIVSKFGERPISIQKIEDLTKICEYKLFMKEQLENKKKEEKKLQQKLRDNYENMRERAKTRMEKQQSQKLINQNQVKLKEQQELEELKNFKQKQEQDIQQLNRLLNDYDKRLQQQKTLIKNHGEVLQHQLNLDKNNQNNSRYQYNLQEKHYQTNDAQKALTTDSSFHYNTKLNEKFFKL